MTIAVRQAGNVTVLDLTGEVDLYHSPTLHGKLAELTTQRQKQIVLNFEGVTYIDSSGLATLIGAFQQLRPHGGTLRLAGVNKNVRSVFTVARLDKVFAIDATEADALKAFGID